jgi:hypothetical protein
MFLHCPFCNDWVPHCYTEVLVELWFSNKIKTLIRILCSVDRASRYIGVKKSQLDAQFIFSIFRQTSQCFGCNHGPSSGGILQAYNSWYVLFFLDDCLLSWFSSNPSRIADRLMVCLLTMGCGYARNM